MPTDSKSHQKLRLLYLVKILQEESDDNHALTIDEIIKMLEVYDVKADRRTLYVDFDDLHHFGLDIIREHIGRSWYYHLGSRDFELPELKLLVDSVQSSKFITEKKSRALIKKLESQVSRYDAQHLHRQVLISGRIKSMNEGVYYNVDTIHEAINTGRQIKFHYFQWNLKKEQELRHGGEWYQVSPWALMWDDENYYLVGYDSNVKQIRHYRVDKMLNLAITEDARQGEADFQGFDAAKYSKRIFGMFSGEEKRVTLEARNDLIGVVIDRFGKDVFISTVDADHFSVSVEVAVSRQFLGWIFALGDGLRITGPEEVVSLMQDEAKRLSEQYSG